MSTLTKPPNKIRFQSTFRRVYFWLIGGLVVSIITFIFSYQAYMYLFWTEQEQFYFPQFVWASWTSFIEVPSESQYLFLRIEVEDKKQQNGVKKVFPQNEFVRFERNSEGKLLFQSNGKPRPIFICPDPSQVKFEWSEGSFLNREVCTSLQSNVYGGHNLIRVSAVPLFITLCVFGSITQCIFFIDSQKQQKFLQGEFVRGTRLLTPREYAQEMTDCDGIGIPVLNVKKR